MLSQKTILLGVAGGIAAYKSCEIVRLLKKEGAQVFVMMTKAAQNFVTPMTFQALSGNPVFTDLFDLSQEGKISHIDLADRADAILIAPATADILAKAANGICDDVVSTVLLATKAPILFAPSMNVNMYHHPATGQNLKTLKERGCHVMEPESGELACGWEGLGRLPEPAWIINCLKEILS